MMGGKSAEREISLMSGKAVLAALKAKGVDAHAFDPKEQGLDKLIKDRFDRVYIALHGRYGEDGTIQGALEIMEIPYTGSGVMASALAMDKWRTKMIWQSIGIRTPRYQMLEAKSDLNSCVERLNLPLIVKPSREGSTIGLTKVVREEQMKDAYQLAAKYDDLVLAEEFIEGQELTVPILGDQALPMIKIEVPQAQGGLYDYQAKYFSDTTRYFCPCGLPADQERSIQELAFKAYQIIGCRGWGRVDLILTKRGEPYFLEVNTSPGMTSHSLVPMGAKQAGISFEELCLRILTLAQLDEVRQ